ncbi:hypothetical protein M5X00_13910 [Paenibacillus alvei]|nr:hypothetical protein [Paenibacillus alvei]MCY9755338.1 hypothetical protein [Paenibacillus alvei]
MSSLEYLVYRRFKKNLEWPFRRIVIDEKEIIPKYRDTSILYESYKMLSPKMYKVVKMHLKSTENETPVLPIVELLIKIVFTLGLAFVGFTMSMSGVLLGQLQSNAEAKKDHFEAWYKIFSNLIQGYQSALDSYWNTFLFGVLIFLITMTHIIFIYLKKNLTKKHLVIIDQIESEKDQ